MHHGTWPAFVLPHSLAAGGIWTVRPLGLVVVGLVLAVGVGLVLFVMVDVVLVLIGAALALGLWAMFRRVGDP